jgi:hypothetical protein
MTLQIRTPSISKDRCALSFPSGMPSEQIALVKRALKEMGHEDPIVVGRNGEGAVLHRSRGENASSCLLSLGPL